MDRIKRQHHHLWGVKIIIIPLPNWIIESIRFSSTADRFCKFINDSRKPIFGPVHREYAVKFFTRCEKVDAHKPTLYVAGSPKNYHILITTELNCVQINYIDGQFNTLNGHHLDMDFKSVIPGHTLDY